MREAVFDDGNICITLAMTVHTKVSVAASVVLLCND